MKILLVGSGGREHALAWKLAQSPRTAKLYCAPGNAGIASCAECIPIKAEDIAGLRDFAGREGVDLTVVGPEAPLAEGIAGLFGKAGLRTYAPSREAAQLETSKAFAKAFCRRHGIPSADSETFDDAEKAYAFARSGKLPIVIKADGLAAGKGVVICKELREAEDTIRGMMLDRRFGGAGRRVVIEEFLEGEEASFIAICDGRNVLPLASSQDHKAAYDGDTGPNTGGMGAVSPARIVTADVERTVMDEVLLPVVQGMADEGMPFVGTLYAGLMIKDGRPRVLEFNARFGDPETQPLLMRLKSDLVEIFELAVEGKLGGHKLEWDARPTACVVMASGGYPGSYEKGKVIKGLADAGALEDVVVFHAGTARAGDDFVTNGGRVLGVTAMGADMRAAIDRAYQAAAKISWDGVHYRKDIGAKAVR